MQNVIIDLIHGLTFIVKYWYFYYLGNDEEIPKIQYGGQKASDMASDFLLFSIFGIFLQAVSIPVTMFYIMPLGVFEAILL